MKKFFAIIIVLLGVGSSVASAQTNPFLQTQVTGIGQAVICSSLKKIDNIITYQSCCTNMAANPLPICQNLTSGEMCKYGGKVLAPSQIQTPQDYRSCCVSNIFPQNAQGACENLAQDQLCAFGALPQNMCLVDLTTQENYQKYCILIPDAQKTPNLKIECDKVSGDTLAMCVWGYKTLRECELIFQNVDAVDTQEKYQRYCILIPDKNKGTYLRNLCDKKMLDRASMCEWGYIDQKTCVENNDLVNLSARKCAALERFSDTWYENQCNRVEAMTKNGFIASSECFGINALKEDTEEWYNAGCNIAQKIDQLNAPVQKSTAVLSTKSKIVEATCQNINLSTVNTKSFWELALWARCFIGSLVPFLLTIAFIVFFLNVVNHVIKPNPTKPDDRKKYLITGLIGLFVIVGLWGLVRFVSGALNFGSVVPRLPMNYLENGKAVDDLTKGREDPAQKK